MNSNFSVQVRKPIYATRRDPPATDIHQNFTVISIFYFPTIFLAKLSVLLLYLELFMIKKQARIMVAVGLTISTLHCLAGIVGNAILCVPKPGVPWEIADDTYNCIVVSDLFSIIMGAISVFSDIYVICIPIPVVWQLQLPTRKRIGISVIFITGVLWVCFPLRLAGALISNSACLASILALVYRIRQYRTRDNTWNASYTFMLTYVSPSTLWRQS